MTGSIPVENYCQLTGQGHVFLDIWIQNAWKHVSIKVFRHFSINICSVWTYFKISLSIIKFLSRNMFFTCFVTWRIWSSKWRHSRALKINTVSFRFKIVSRGLLHFPTFFLPIFILKLSNHFKNRNNKSFSPFKRKFYEVRKKMCKISLYSSYVERILTFCVGTFKIYQIFEMLEIR